MRYILIILLLFSLSGSAQIINQYGTLSYGFSKGVDTTLLYDLKGGVDGTKAGTTFPYWNSTGNYMIFRGGNAGLGDRGRIELARGTFEYAYNSSFSQVLIFRSTKNDAVIHGLFYVANLNAATDLISIRLLADEKLSVFYVNATTKSKSAASAGSACDGKWHIVVTTYSTNVLKVYYDGLLLTTSETGSFSSGNLYQTNSKASIGSAWYNTTANYGLDATADIPYFMNYAGVLTPDQVMDIQNEFLLLY